VILATVLSSIITILFLAPQRLAAHEIVPAIADMTQVDDRLAFSVTLNIEAVLAGIDLSTVSDTNTAPEAASYDELRALEPDALTEMTIEDWPAIASQIQIEVDGVSVVPVLGEVVAGPVGDIEVIRTTDLTFTVPLPNGAQNVTFGWAPALGTIVLRQQGVEEPYTGYLETGARSEPIALTGGGEVGQIETFLGYIPVGFDHILPKGLDHILFVLGLFFLSTRLRPLLWQVSAFTVAHTITLALAALGYVSVPGSIVEPLIAASIVFVAVENILTDGLSKWRPFVVFGFGLLHGLGFASVLGEFGLPASAFVAALIGFNVGVELGQITVIVLAFAAVGFWFGRKQWYRRVIAVPASAAIAFVGAYWFVERVFF